VLYEHALDVLGDAETVRNWFNTPEPDFSDMSPLAPLDTAPRIKEVDHLLGRIEHGVLERSVFTVRRSAARLFTEAKRPALLLQGKPNCGRRTVSVCSPAKKQSGTPRSPNAERRTLDAERSSNLLARIGEPDPPQFHPEQAHIVGELSANAGPLNLGDYLAN
jgi:hypothetical protein